MYAGAYFGFDDIPNNYVDEIKNSKIVIDMSDKVLDYARIWYKWGNVIKFYNIK